MSLTPLHYAIVNEHYNVARYLLESGADINANEEEKIGETPLGHVAASCTYEMAEFLINHGANPTISRWMQITALDRTKERKKMKAKKFLNCYLKQLLKSIISRHNKLSEFAHKNHALGPSLHSATSTWCC